MKEFVGEFGIINPLLMMLLLIGVGGWIKKYVWDIPKEDALEYKLDCQKCNFKGEEENRDV